MATWGNKLLKEFQQYHPHMVKNNNRPISKWEFPPRGLLKINFDGAFHPDSHKGGIDVVVRDGEGLCVATFHRSITHATSTIHVETEACRASLLIALQQGWNGFTLETDCVALKTALFKIDDDFSKIGQVIGDCKEPKTIYLHSPLSIIDIFIAKEIL